MPPLRREAGRALGGRVPVVLAVGIALMSGWGLGFGWRGLLCDRECTRAPTVIRRCASPPLVADPMAPPRLILIDEDEEEDEPKPREGQCAGAAPTSGAAVATPAVSTPKALPAAPPAGVVRPAPAVPPAGVVRPAPAAPAAPSSPPVSLD